MIRSLSLGVVVASLIIVAFVAGRNETRDARYDTVVRIAAQQSNQAAWLTAKLENSFNVGAQLFKDNQRLQQHNTILAQGYLKGQQYLDQLTGLLEQHSIPVPPSPFASEPAPAPTPDGLQPNET